jgi:DNA-binding Lrp family transcriptional regulator
MLLKPQDILVLLKLIAIKEAPWTYNQLALELGMSPSEVHAAVKRALRAHLAISIRDGIQANRSALEEFILHGIKYVFVPEMGEMTRGMPTIYSVDPLKDLLSGSAEPQPVWPDPMGEARGSSFSPLYKSVPHAARKDKTLYELLVLVDAIRGGRARERALATKEIKRRLGK